MRESFVAVLCAALALTGCFAATASSDGRDTGVTEAVCGTVTVGGDSGNRMCLMYSHPSATGVETRSVGCGASEICLLLLDAQGESCSFSADPCPEPSASVSGECVLGMCVPAPDASSP